MGCRQNQRRGRRTRSHQASLPGASRVRVQSGDFPSSGYRALGNAHVPNERSVSSERQQPSGELVTPPADAQQAVAVWDALARTAEWTACMRSHAALQPRSRLNDPFASLILQELNTGLRDGQYAPASAASAVSVIALRTLVFDDLIVQAIRDARISLVLNLGAGFDTRPYRLALPPDCRWVEVDQEAVVERKRRLFSAISPQCQLDYVACDLVQRSERIHLFEHLATHGGRSLVITEGVLIYLREDEVAGLASDLASLLRAHLWITDLGSRYFVAQDRHATWCNEAPRNSMPANTPAASTVAAMPPGFAPAVGSGFFADYGWREQCYRSYFEEGHRLGYTRLLPWLLSRALLRVAAPHQSVFLHRLAGAVLLERAVTVG